MAFTDSLLSGRATTPEAVDLAVGRKPEDIPNPTKTNLWLLQQRHRIGQYLTEFAVDAFLPYVDGRITADSFLDAWEDKTGEHSEGDKRDQIINHHETVMKPEFHKMSSMLEEYRQTGECIEHTDRPPTPELVKELVRAGKVALCYENNGDGTLHNVAIFQPRSSHLALVYCPGERTRSEKTGSAQESFIAYSSDDYLYGLDYNTVITAVY